MNSPGNPFAPPRGPATRSHSKPARIRQQGGPRKASLPFSPPRWGDGSRGFIRTTASMRPPRPRAPCCEGQAEPALPVADLLLLLWLAFALHIYTLRWCSWTPRGIWAPCRVGISSNRSGRLLIPSTSDGGAGAECREISVCLGDAMSAYNVVMGTLLLAPWALLGAMMVGTALSSVAVSKRRHGPVILPAASSIKRSSF